MHKCMPYIDSAFILSNYSYAKDFFLFLYTPLGFLISAVMVPQELEKPRITEIQVRIDCNGCVQKIKKALHGINGIYDYYFDFSQQKLTIIGWADPENIVRAIRKSRKTAIICSHSEQTDQQQPQPTEAAPGEGQPPTDSAPPPPAEGAPPADSAPPAGPPKDAPPPEHPPQEVAPPPPSGDATTQPGQPLRAKDVEEIRVVYHHPPDYGYRYRYSPTFQVYGGQGSNSINAPGIIHEPPPPQPQPQSTQPIYVAHSYNTYNPSPYVTEFVAPPSISPHHNRQEPPQYVHSTRQEPPKYMQYYNKQESTQYSHNSRPEPPQYSYYSRLEPPEYSYYIRPEPQQYTHYSEDYRSGNNGNGNITSIFSDENPNACRIV